MEMRTMGNVLTFVDTQFSETNSVSEFARK